MGLPRWSTTRWRAVLGWAAGAARVTPAPAAGRHSVTCVARIGVAPGVGAASVQRGGARSAAGYAAASASRNSSRCTSLTSVTPAARRSARIRDR